MPIAFVMIQAEPAKIVGVAQAVANLPDVTEVYSITGDFDILAVVRAPNHEQLSDTIPQKLARVDGIRRTNTLLAFRQYSRRDIEAGWDIGVD